MEVINDQSHSKTKAILIIIGSLAAIVVTACLILHLTPLGMWHLVADYASHHYFSVGFISSLVALGCWRSYTTMEAELKKRYYKKIQVTSSRRKRRWFERKLRQGNKAWCFFLFERAPYSFTVFCWSSETLWAQVFLRNATWGNKSHSWEIPGL